MVPRRKGTNTMRGNLPKGQTTLEGDLVLQTPPRRVGISPAAREYEPVFRARLNIIKRMTKDFQSGTLGDIKRRNMEMEKRITSKTEAYHDLLKELKSTMLDSGAEEENSWLSRYFQLQKEKDCHLKESIDEIERLEHRTSLPDDDQLNKVKEQYKLKLTEKDAEIQRLESKISGFTATLNRHGLTENLTEEFENSIVGKESEFKALQASSKAKLDNTHCYCTRIHMDDIDIQIQLSEFFDEKAKEINTYYHESLEQISNDALRYRVITRRADICIDELRIMVDNFIKDDLDEAKRVRSRFKLRSDFHEDIREPFRGSILETKNEGHVNSEGGFSHRKKSSLFNYHGLHRQCGENDNPPRTSSPEMTTERTKRRRLAEKVVHKAGNLSGDEIGQGQDCLSPPIYANLHFAPELAHPSVMYGGIVQYNCWHPPSMRSMKQNQGGSLNEAHAAKTPNEGSGEDNSNI